MKPEALPAAEPGGGAAGARVPGASELEHKGSTALRGVEGSLDFVSEHVARETCAGKRNVGLSHMDADAPVQRY
jgi:hypothetical protein